MHPLSLVNNRLNVIRVCCVFRIISLHLYRLLYTITHVNTYYMIQMIEKLRVHEGVSRSKLALEAGIPRISYYRMVKTGFISAENYINLCRALGYKVIIAKEVYGE